MRADSKDLLHDLEQCRKQTMDGRLLILLLRAIFGPRQWDRSIFISRFYHNISSN